jgi:hypothetical protein
MDEDETDDNDEVSDGHQDDEASAIEGVRVLKLHNRIRLRQYALNEDETCNEDKDEISDQTKTKMTTKRTSMERLIPSLDETISSSRDSRYYIAAVSVC